MVENTEITKMGLSDKEDKAFNEYKEALEQAHKRIAELTLTNSRKNTKLILTTIVCLIIAVIVTSSTTYNNGITHDKITTRINKDYRELYRSVKRENVLLRNNALEAEQMRLVYNDALERESFANIVEHLPEDKKAEWFAFVEWVNNNADKKFNNDEPILPDGAKASNNL